MNDDHDSDAAIVERVLSGDTEAFRSLVDRYSDRLYRFCRARLGCDSDAEDAVQDVLVRAFRSLRSYDASRSWPSWLFAIAANRVKSRYASRAADVGLLYRAGLESLAAGDEAMDSSDPERMAVDAVTAESLRAAVASLPPAYRAPVELYYFAGLGISDIAAALRLGEEAVKTRLFRARKSLARSLGEKGQPIGLWKGRR